MNLYDAWQYDANGNRVRYTNTQGVGDYTTGPGNLLITDGVYSYTYDDEGQRTQRTRISDGQTTDYVWDHRHRLTRVTVTTPGTGSGTVRTVDYAYDVFDRLVERTVSGTGLTTHREGRLFDGDAVLAEYNPDTGSLTINRSRRAHSEDAGGGR